MFNDSQAAAARAASLTEDVALAGEDGLYIEQFAVASGTMDRWTDCCQDFQNQDIWRQGIASFLFAFVQFIAHRRRTENGEGILQHVDVCEQEQS